MQLSLTFASQQLSKLIHRNNHTVSREGRSPEEEQRNFFAQEAPVKFSCRRELHCRHRSGRIRRQKYHTFVQSRDGHISSESRTMQSHQNCMLSVAGDFCPCDRLPSLFFVFVFGFHLSGYKRDIKQERAQPTLVEPSLTLLSAIVSRMSPFNVNHQKHGDSKCQHGCVSLGTATCEADKQR